MSLVDSLLLDPYPFDIWVAWRSGGLKGSRTLGLVARGNVIRNVEEIGDRGKNSKTIEMSGCESALLEQNIIDLPSGRPLEHNSCGELQTFNNLRPGGALVESFLQGSNENAPEVTVKVRADLEDAMVSAFLKSQED